MTNEGLNYGQDEKSFIGENTIKLIDRELKQLIEKTASENPNGYGEGRIGAGFVLH